jgi:hypothetical protein
MFHWQDWPCKAEEGVSARHFSKTDTIPDMVALIVILMPRHQGNDKNKATARTM